MLSYVNALRAPASLSKATNSRHMKSLTHEKQDTRLPQVQKLRKPPHSRVLGPLNPSLLFRIALVAPDGESVGQAGEILVVVFDAQAGDHAVGVRFQLGGQLRVVFWGDDLDGDGDGVDFFLC